MKKKFFVVSLLMLVLTLVALTTVLAAGAWSDNFDSYPTGQDLHGVGGWKGWFNDPTFTAFTTDVQARSAPNSVDINGNSDLVHEYTNTSGLWCYRFWQYIPTAMQGASYFIMLNQYDDAGATNNWSVQVNFDSTTGLMTDDGSSGATMAYVPGQWVENTLEIDLTNDTQEYSYNGAVFYTGTWSGHVSGGGITAIGAVDLFANGATSVYYDDMELVQGDCSAPPPTATPTNTPIPPTPTNTPVPPTATPTATPEPTDVDVSAFGGSSGAMLMPLLLVALVAAAAMGWFVSKRQVVE